MADLSKKSTKELSTMIDSCRTAIDTARRDLQQRKGGAVAELRGKKKELARLLTEINSIKRKEQ